MSPWLNCLLTTRLIRKNGKNANIIRYRNYDAQGENNNYKREMVTLHLPFRDEENDVLAEQ